VDKDPPSATSLPHSDRYRLKGHGRKWPWEKLSEKQLGELRDRTDTLLKLRKAPSQFQIVFHLLGTARTMSVKELSTELCLTPKATERAVAKLVEKNLIQRSPFKDGGYTCDTKQIVLSLLVTVSDMYEYYDKAHPRLVQLASHGSEVGPPFPPS
jgi:predicted transcriptional regulator